MGSSKKRDRSKERKKKKHARDHSDDEQHHSSSKRKDKERDRSRERESTVDKDRKEKSREDSKQDRIGKKDEKLSSKAKEDKSSSKAVEKSVVAYSSDSEESSYGEEKKEKDSSRRKRKSRPDDIEHDVRSSKSRRHQSPEKDSHGKDKKRSRDDHSDDEKKSSHKKSHKDDDHSKRSSSSKKTKSRKDEGTDYHRGDGQDNKPEDVEQEATTIVKSGTIEMSIEETNKLRTKLGLKPLQVDDGLNKENDAGDTSKPVKKEDIHAPPKNIGDLKLQEKLKERLEVLREKRRIHKSLGEVKTLAVETDEESTEAWVDKLRKAQKDKEIAEQTARTLEQLDEEFGISDIIEETMIPKKKEKQPAEVYSSRDLRGLKVEHGEDSFREGRDIVLTLKDTGVLDDAGDILENINIIEKQKAEKNVELKKKTMDYNPYEDDEFDEYGNYQPKQILKKYNEEIDGVKKDSIVLGESGSYDATVERERQIMRDRLKATAVSLEGIPARIASEYYTSEEMLQFKKPKRKKKVKKQVLKPDDLIPLAEGSVDQFDHGSRSSGRRRLNDDVEMEMDDNFGDGLSSLGMEPTESSVSSALERAKMIKNVKQEHSSVAERVASLLAGAPTVKQEPPDFYQGDGMALVLDSTAEFCRQVGGDDMDRKHSVKEEDMDFSDDGGHSPNRPESPKEKDLYQEPEPVMSGGVIVALQMANRKGFLMTEEDRKKLKEQSRTIVRSDRAKIVYREDKDREREWKERDRDRDRDRDSYRSTSSFAEKKDYRPDVKVEYVDDFGRMLDPKEAFRHMSHKFHGKGSGRKKTEKRYKKLQEEFSLQGVGSGGSGLNTFSLLQEKQKSNKAAYLVLSGAQALLTSEDIGKK